MKCVDAEKLLDEFIGDELDFSVRQRISLHLRECAACRTEAKAIQDANHLLKNLSAVTPSTQFDARMMRAFQEHRKTKNRPNFPAAFFAHFSTSRAALAFGALILIAFTTLAFQLGKISASNSEVANSKTIESAAPVVQIVEKRVEVPVIKTVEVPVYKEKIITRIVYRNRSVFPKPEFARQSPDIDSLNNAATFIQTSGERFTPLNLKDYQPDSEVKISIIKREENEK